MSVRAKKDLKNEVIEESANFLHPKSRKSLAMIKKIKKDSKKEKAKQETKLKQSLVADKLLWIQKNMDHNICQYTVELTADLIERYISRNDEELDQIKIKRSIGESRSTQHISREQVIRMTKERERNDYETCGIEIPNILNATQCNMLKKWNGDLKFISNFKFCRFTKRQVDEKLKKKQRLAHSEDGTSESIHTSTLDEENKKKMDID